MEKAVLITPIVSSSTVTSYSILSVTPQFGVQGYPDTLDIVYIDNLGNVAAKSFDGATAVGLNNAFNNMDFRTNSLRKQSLQFLISQGVIPPATIVNE